MDKQIEEILSIAKIVDKKCDYIKCKNCDVLDNFTDEKLKGLYCSEIKIAENIYNAGYRKIDKDSVVLTREELSKRDYEFRQIGYDECLRDNPKKDKYIKTLERKIDHLKAKLDQASKETAEKFAKLIEFHSISKRDESGYETFTISNLCLREILREEFGFTNEELETIWEIKE